MSRKSVIYSVSRRDDAYKAHQGLPVAGEVIPGVADVCILLPGS